MSDISSFDFKGHLISQGFNSVKIEKCHVCNNEPVMWVEARGMGDLAEIRLTCEKCHQEFLSKVEQVEILTKIEDFSIYDQVPTENEDITPTERPAWMEEFIEQGKQSGSISTLDELNEVGEIEEVLVNENQNEDLSLWSAGFVKEALFGANPESWLETQGAFNEDQVDATISTLGSFSNNEVGSIKLSAILCLNSVATKYSNRRSAVITELEKFTSDNEDTVLGYAKETISKLK